MLEFQAVNFYYIEFFSFNFAISYMDIKEKIIQANKVGKWIKFVMQDFIKGLL